MPVPDSHEVRIKEGEFREWTFPISEVLKWVRTFLKDAGYEMLAPQPVGLVVPDVHARRKEGNRAFEIVAIGAQHTDKAVDAMTRLAAMRTVLGDKADYVLVMPPISEYLLLELLREAEGRWYFAMKGAKMMMWLANPDEEFVWSVIGEPQDRVFRGMFAAGKMSLDFFLNRELAQKRWSEEEY
ncbi:MAG: hypothetical protein HYY32_05390 [Chloroflexi bacterium]|nr:hypothetical protein [Chloroflexota bacterium]